ncbi:MAG: hypothetical protein J0L92_07180 [Deltaproteobacteria bacterium]|nr:hypothetical protein [Deltaproteobacteria bacterium]
MTTNETKKTQSCGCTTARERARETAPRCACGDTCRCGEQCTCEGCSHRKG